MDIYTAAKKTTEREEEFAFSTHPAADEEEETLYTGKKVLLVEDNVLNVEIATELLQSIGLTVD